jgi:hypothetical protein
MVFPKRPNNKVSGNLKITVRPPGVSLETEKKEQVVSFKPPLGFSMETSMGNAVKKAAEIARESLKQILAKQSKCPACPQVSYISYNTAFLLLERLEVMASFKEDKFHLILGQQEDAKITLGILYSDKQCSIIINGLTFSYGLYDKDELTKEVIDVGVEDCNNIILFLLGMEI